MAIARYSFLPWLRRGIANQIQAAANNAPRAELDAVLTLETKKAKAGNENQLTDTATQKLRLIGPGDITGIHKNMVVRTEPRNWITDFEPNYLAFIEFYDEDFPWRYSPEPPTGHRLHPWLALMVVKDSEFDRVTMPGRPLPAIKLKGANWQNFLPPANQTWAWAHVHINEIINNAALTDHDFSEADRSALENILKNNPDAGISRLVSPRHLEPKTPYHAFVIPTFEVGRKAGDGLPDKATGAALMCYASGVDEAEAVRETVAILKQADLAPLDVEGYGTLDERLAAGDEIDAEERALMERALAENSVIVAQMTPFFD